MSLGTTSELPTMPLLEHLRELRKRLIWSSAAIILGMIVGWFFSQTVIEQLLDMCTKCAGIIQTDVMEGLITRLRVSFVLGLALAMPMVLYQLVAFIMPALHRNELRYLWIFLPGASVLFIIGLIFGFTFVVPRTVNFLVGFLEGTSTAHDGTIAIMPRIGNYVNFLTNLILVLGLAFQTPLVVLLLAKLGILSPQSLGRYRRHAVVIIAVVAAIVTPTPDPFTMFLVMIPMYILYELGIVLARIL